MTGGRLVCIVISAVVLTVAHLQHIDHLGHDIDWSALNSTETIRAKRIVLGNKTLPVRPLPVGNLSSPQGNAVCHFIDSRFYCFSQFLATFQDARRYCQSQKMKLLFIENEEEHEYLYYFMSSLDGTIEKFKKKTDFPSEEAYTDYVFENISPGLIVRCVSICGNIRPTSEGRVLDFEDKEFIGLAVKVQWKTGQVRWYPAGNLQIGGYISKSPTRPTDASLEDLIFEPGDRVRIKTTISVSQRDVWQNVKLREVGVIADVDLSDRSAIVFFPSNRGWRSSLSNMEVIDKRKVIGTFWTSGRLNQTRLTWAANNKNIEFTNWAPGEPGLRTRGEKCVEIKYHKEGKWFSASCSKKSFFICKSEVK